MRAICKIEQNGGGGGGRGTGVGTWGGNELVLKLRILICAVPGKDM